MKRKFISSSSSQTKEFAKDFAWSLAPQVSKQALIIALKGELGSGKTTFLQGFAKGLGIREKILSPTFVILKKFKITKREKFLWFYHIDCYRIQRPRELIDLGFQEIISDPENIVAIEWPEKIKNLLAKDVVQFIFEFIDEKTRKITIKRS